ncbi:hypothetical protein [Planctomicrobium piriforme]|nr:hypothetical protein [Planctomicrobium piriforme]
MSASLGCGGGQATQTAPQSTVTLKDMVTQRGENPQSIGSGSMLFQDAFVEYEKANPEKAAAIKPEFEAMLAADNNPEQARKLAKSLAPKL